MRQLLLVPLLAPLLAALLIGAVNPRPRVALRLLIWTSPALPIGVWMILAAAGGAALSAGGTALALRANGERELQRQVRRPVNPWTEFSDAAPGPHPRPRPEPAAAAAPSAGPTRAAGESSPTVAVPYRVIRRAGTGAAPSTAPPAAHPASETVAASGQGWGVPLAESW